jgi:hypothetical protein
VTADVPDRTARAQHKTLAWTTASRIERMAAQAQDDYEHGRPVSVDAAQQIVAAALTLYREAIAIATRDEIAARAAREGAGREVAVFR